MNIKIKKSEEDFVIAINSYFLYGVFDDTDDLVPILILAPILIKQGVYNKPSIEILKHNTPNSTI